MKKTLKMTALLLSIVTMGLFPSCSKDNSETIVGTWGCTSSYYHLWGHYPNDGGYHSGESYDETYTDGAVGFVVSFNENGTYTASRDCYFFKHFFFNKDGGSWMISDSKLFLNSSRVPVEIKKLNNKTLELFIHATNVEYEDQVDVKMEFKRQ